MEISTNILKEYETILTTQNEHAQRIADKEQNAYLAGLIAGLEIITAYNYTFDKQSNKIKKINY